jgi:CBS domain containing-hemolysin-like protein
MMAMHSDLTAGILNKRILGFKKARLCKRPNTLHASIAQCCPVSSLLPCLQSGEGLKPPELVVVRPCSTLREVLALLVEHRLHRLHVTDERQRPVGIVTITDLLRVIVGCNELLEALGPVRLLLLG